MATEAQIEANRRNAQKSTGPRTEAGKKRSRSNALDHGCRANLLVLPTEEFGEYENQSRAWRLSFNPRNPSEEFLIDRIVSLGCLTKRIDRAHTARLAARIHSAEVDVADSEREQVLALAQRLFQRPAAQQANDPKTTTGKSAREANTRRTDEFWIDPDDPRRLVNHLEWTATGCAWLLEQWGELRDLLERGVTWLAPDKFKAIRLLGQRSTDAVDSKDVALVYLACHLLLNAEGNPFQELLDELAPERAPTYEYYLKQRHYESLAPKDAAAAKQVLLDIVDRATERLEEKAEALRELAELDAPFTADRLSWDDTAEGERLRRYELTGERTWLRMFDLLLKIRTKGDELDIATIESLRRSVPSVTRGAVDRPAESASSVIIPPAKSSRNAGFADRSQIRDRKSAERSQFCCSGAQSRSPRWAQRPPNGYSAPRTQAWRDRDRRSCENPSRARAGTGRSEIDTHEPDVDIRRAFNLRKLAQPR
jgi:hypothetical protein